jgi:hypothetical protein
MLLKLCLEESWQRTGSGGFPCSPRTLITDLTMGRALSSLIHFSQAPDRPVESCCLSSFVSFMGEGSDPAGMRTVSRRGLCCEVMFVFILFQFLLGWTGVSFCWEHNINVLPHWFPVRTCNSSYLPSNTLVINFPEVSLLKNFFFH